MKGYVAQQVLGGPSRLAVIRYSSALLAVIVGVLLAFWLQSVLDASVVLLLAILIAAWFSGFWPALLASVLATLALDYFFTPPLYTLSVEIAHVPHLIVFTLIAVFFSSISAGRRRAERSLMQARDELELKVRERTADLTLANRRLATQYAVTRVLADSDSLDAAMAEVLRIIGTTMNWDWGALWKLDREAQVLRCASTWCAPEVLAQGFAGDRDLTFGPGHGVLGQVWQSGQPRWIADVARDPGFVRTASAAEAGFHAATAFPILVGNDAIGVIEFFSRAVRQPNREELDTLSALGSQIGQVIERRRAEEERERLLIRERAAHAEAAASQQRFQDLVNSIEGIVWEVDARKLRFSFVSQQAEHILGYPVARWLQEPTFRKDHIHPEDREWAVNFCVTATAEKRDHDLEYRMAASDGRVVWMRDLVSVVVEDGQVTRLRGVMFDITLRKQAEEALREQASLLDLTHDTIFVRDMNDVIRYWNRGAAELYGWTSDEAVGQVSHRLTQTIFPAPLEAINAELLERGRWEGELVHTKRDGSQVVVASRWSLQRGADGRPIAILETNNDVTERRRAEEALRKMQDELARVTRVQTMGELAASIAHEVNQPLAAVVTNGNAGLRWLAGETPNLEEAREASRRIIRDANRASEVITGIRAFFKRSESQKVWLNVNDVVQDVIALTRNELGRSQVALRAELSILPPVHGDRVQLGQVILNLILNAAEAMSSIADRHRQLTIRTENHDSAEVLVAVEDTGSGLDPKGMDRLFEAFFTTKPNGMGMGLSISRTIVEAHGGRLWATPNAGPGATFQFTLPASAVSDSLTEPALPRNSTPASIEQGSS